MQLVVHLHGIMGSNGLNTEETASSHSAVRHDPTRKYYLTAADILDGTQQMSACGHSSSVTAATERSVFL
jgi:hypothetical protein